MRNERKSNTTKFHSCRTRNFNVYLIFFQLLNDAPAFAHALNFLFSCLLVSLSTFHVQLQCKSRSILIMIDDARTE